MEEKLSVEKWANAVWAVDALVLAVTMLILEESVIAPLPDDAVTSVSELELEAAVEEDELLSSLAQPSRTRLIATSIAIKLLALFIMLLCMLEESRNKDSRNPYRIFLSTVMFHGYIHKYFNNSKEINLIF